ncbi:VENN motif pre-toxin domain-containing protein [Yersinia pseudotuberculosis]|uniref:VENN motif pre-toxin domain-containing protein n=1 Tax=Yersinia pseudotuberculosis TaxID=633 RepID=UPI0038B5ACE2
MIKQSTGDNEEARLAAHAVVGSVLAHLQGNSAVAGAQAGKNAVENNLLGGGTEDGQVKAAQEHAKNILSCADNPGSASCQKGLAMQDALMVALPAGLGGGLLAAATPEIAAAAKAAIQACAGNVVLCLNNARCRKLSCRVAWVLAVRLVLVKQRQRQRRQKLRPLLLMRRRISLQI